MRTTRLGALLLSAPLLLAPLLPATLAGCDGGDDTDAGTDAGDDAGRGLDAGMEIDGGNVEVDAGNDAGDPDGGSDAGMMETCGARELTLTAGAQQISGDTTGRSADLTLTCAESGPQEVLLLNVPGTGVQIVTFDLATETTSFELDTVIEVRAGACDSDVDAICVDDNGDDLRSRVVFEAMGGDSVFVVVAGLDASYEGPWAADVTVQARTAPVLTSLDVARVEDLRLDITVAGSDDGGDAESLLVEYLDSTGTAIEIDGATEHSFLFTDSAAGQTTFTGVLTRIDIEGISELAALTDVRARIVDAAGVASAPMEASVRAVMQSDLGESCDADDVCAPGYVCAGTCTVPVCPAATAITFPAVITATETRTATGDLAPGAGVIEASCSNTRGPESLFSVTLPAAGTYDVIATTDLAANPADLDTIVYIQAVCGDPASGGGASACGDDVDVSEGNLRSRAEARDLTAASGPVTIGVEIYREPTGPTPFSLEVSLRPVLPLASPCDPSGAANRCGLGDCVGTPPTCTEL
jgi:hypothetical protein